MSTLTPSSIVDHTPGPLRQKLLQVALTSAEFTTALRGAASEIRGAARPDVTEATVEGHFERVVYALLREIGLKFNPDKEEKVELRRHVARGRTDSRLGALVIEYKRPSLLNTQDQIDRASAQLGRYLEALSEKEETPFTGLLTNGLVVIEMTAFGGKVTNGPSSPETLDERALLRLTRSVISLALTALTPANLIRDFCGSLTDGAIFDAARALYGVLSAKPSAKTSMLESEWRVLFSLAHEDQSQQKKIEERKKALGEVFSEMPEMAEKEYRMLFALHTAYAITLKLLAYRVVSDTYLDRVPIEFHGLASASSDYLQTFCAELEDGDIFRTLGILNLLEGDFFSWYSDAGQWNNAFAEAVKQIAVILARYEEAKNVFEAEEAQDLFRDLYQAAVPKAVRSSFGEVYTPYWLAEHVLESTKPRESWRAIDPCCGSGTFVIAAISKLRKELDGMTAESVLEEILSRVQAVDLHPLAVLTARVNYFIHVSPFLEPGHGELVIPVYLGDASSIPTSVIVDGVECLKHNLKTLKAPVECILPASLVRDTPAFMKLMYSYELCIKERDAESAYDLLHEAVPATDRKPAVVEHLKELTSQLIGLETKGWNGIWARILSNFFTTSCLGKFDVVIGNPPWIDWKNLPQSYRERIKADVVDPKLFSGAGLTGGINLNICALIAYVSLVNWLSDEGVLAFLMPRELINQASYEGWRRLGSEGWKFLEFHDWTLAGHPFEPVREDFLTFVIGKNGTELQTVPVSRMIRQKKSPKAFDWKNRREALKHLEVKSAVARQIIPQSTAFTVADSEKELLDFALVAGRCEYTGREGIEFYPQELLLFKYDGPGPVEGTAWMKNVQVTKSKYKLPERRHLLETHFLHPLVKGPAIEPFRHEYDGLIVALPYSKADPKKPLGQDVLKRLSPRLLKYYTTNKGLMDQQTKFSNKIIGAAPVEFYGLARTGPYSFAENYVAFRDNTKWGATVISSAKMPWNGKKRFVFQNHAVSMCERSDGTFITSDEAHYICAILNSSVVDRFIQASSDERSYKIRPPVFVPLYDPADANHTALVKASKEAHDEPSKIPSLREQIDQTYLDLCKKARPDKQFFSDGLWKAMESLESFGVSPTHARLAREAWSLFAFTTPVREPIIQITSEGDVQFAWNRDRYYLDLDIHPDGKVAWFFRDRVNDDVDGTENYETSLSENFWNRFKLAGVKHG